MPTVALSVTFNRSSYELPDLTITNYPSDSAPWWLPEDGLTEPEYPADVLYAPVSDYYPGSAPLAAKLGIGTLNLNVYVKATPSVTLAQAKAVINAAAMQFTYPIQLAINGEIQTGTAVFAVPQWGPVDAGMVRAGIARAEITIPINPTGV